MRAWMEPDAFESQVIEPEEFEVAGSRVLVRQHATARGAGSGIEMEIDAWSLWTFDEEGRATRVEFYLHHQEDEARAPSRSAPLLEEVRDVDLGL